ncbi:peroxisome biogenesis protein 3-2-like [Nicotiana tabacum]|uniref:Peroxisome biogenesis protein 3-2-like n=1 Tax=Nicotiana tabacum TaxID=4097 RepID=A0A1S4ABR5_TOBAC|nr:PREDICTED: peroxisome biogenesis protein 3-2-like [Nicotiana tabacum]
MWEFWRRHKRKVYVTLGVIGSGYLLFKLYDGHRRRLSDLERELADERRNEELIRSQVKAHFENIQGIADSTTLPHVMRNLRSRIEEELDLALLTERLMKGKDQPNSLTAAEKLELWERLKILTFTRIVLSLWATTVLSLYIRVQVNILGRHLYIDTARGLGTSCQLDEADLIDRDDEQQFLASADYLTNVGLPALISSFETAASEVLKGKQLKDFFNTTLLHDTVLRILDTFMSLGSPHHWLGFLMPEHFKLYNSAATFSSGNTEPSPSSKFEQLMLEARTVLSSSEFENILDLSLKTAVDVMMEDVTVLCGETNLKLGIPLAKLLPRLAHMSRILLEESNRNRYIQVVQDMPVVEMFFTLLYASTPTS